MAEIIDLEKNEPAGMPRWILSLIGVSVVALLWVLCFLGIRWALSLGTPALNKEELSNLATLLFGASGISMAVFSLIVGGVAVLGWSTLKENVRKEVEDVIREDLKKLEKELRGRVLAAVGMVLGLFYARTDDVMPGKGSDRQARAAERSDYLAEVVGHCWRAYKELKEVNSLGQYMALNNYVYFSSLHGNPDSRSLLLERATDLRKVAEEKSYWDALLTYCLAISTFSNEQTKIREAHKLAQELEKKGDLTVRQRREAAQLAASLSSLLQPDQGNPASR
jgi:hypothetical protein